MFEQCDLIQGEWIDGKLILLVLYRNQTAFLHFVFATNHLGDGRFQAGSGDLGQKSEMARVDSQNGDTPVANFFGHREESTVASHGKRQICGAIVSIESLDPLERCPLFGVFSQKRKELSFHCDRYPCLAEQPHDSPGVIALLNLVTITENSHPT